MEFVNTSGVEFWANGDRVQVVEGIVTDGELARQALVDGAVIPVSHLTSSAIAGLRFAAGLIGTAYTIVEVTERLERVTGEESDAELTVSSFQALQECAGSWDEEPTQVEPDPNWRMPLLSACEQRPPRPAGIWDNNEPTLSEIRAVGGGL